MEKKDSLWQTPLVKVFIIMLLALLMLVPLHLIRKQVDERSYHYSSSVDDITKNWGTALTFSGPSILYQYSVVEDNENKSEFARLYPDSLKYIVNSVSQELHRSIYDVSVFTADIIIQGCFILDSKLAEVGKGEVILLMGDLKGIQGNPTFTLCGKNLEVSSTRSTIIDGIKADVMFDKGAKEGDVLPFLVTMKINGSESIFFTPAGKMTEVEMVSDYPAPSFGGDFLPVNRDVRADGFTARWLVSQITMANPLSTYSFGVRLVMPVTQYRETERAIKYGLLIIFLVFIAGFIVEMLSKKPINIIQYLVIGASLVLFYSLLLALSDFLSFSLSYLIAALMTSIALGAYFIGIVKNKWAWLLTGLVAVGYSVSYVLLQLDNFAFLAGTLLLFLILCVIMALTRNMKLEYPRSVPTIDSGEQEDPKTY